MILPCGRNKIMDYKIVDNFLEEEYFNFLVTLVTGAGGDRASTSLNWNDNALAWGFQPTTNPPAAENPTAVFSPPIDPLIFHMTHMFYDDNLPCSPHLEKMWKLFTELKVMALIRVKGNLYPMTHKLYEHEIHNDYEHSHKGAILYINSCDGYTKLEDGTKVDSVANRVLLFDPSTKHCSTTTTNASARFNININYF